MKTVAFVPIKMNNERTPGKNTKCFDDGTPLIHCILQSLKEAREVDEIYVYCSKEDIKGYLLPDVHYLKRDEKFDSAQADVNDMFYTFSTEVDADIYVLAHATAPFQTAGTIDEGIRIVKEGQYDSAVAVKKMQDFMWQDGKPLNYVIEHIPRTQDLKPIYIETTGLYVYTKTVIQEMRRRIGQNPYLLEVSEIEAIDINNPVDFEIANAIKMNIINR
ncbi:MAG: acylneuraminate cytidylyltransferase family protein [Lachnospiraceae bacterium]|nr:acylneuraminate cytidylyltransferase family protein [Lachnospiraceae bacterium]